MVRQPALRHSQRIHRPLSEKDAIVIAMTRAYLDSYPVRGTFDVTCRLVGRTILDVMQRTGKTQEPEEGSLGRVQHHPWAEDFPPDIEINGRQQRQMENAILTLLAGTRAEKLYTGRWNYAGASYDIHTAVKLAGYLTGSDEALQAYFTWMEVRTTDMVCQPFNWVAIQALAAALLQQPRMNARQARRIVAEARAHYLKRPSDQKHDEWQAASLRRRQLLPQLARKRKHQSGRA